MLARSPIRPRNPKRWALKWRRNFVGPFPGYSHREHVVRQPCCGCGRRDGIEPAHAIARGMGGAKGDWSVLVPLCVTCHRQYDIGCANSPVAYQQATGVDLLAYAEHLANHALGLAVTRYPDLAEEFQQAWEESWMGRRG